MRRWTAAELILRIFPLYRARKPHFLYQTRSW